LQTQNNLFNLQEGYAKLLLINIMMNMTYM